MQIPVFKQNNQGQISLFPARLDENIAENDLVRLINKIVDAMEIKDLLSGYKGGGTSAYHPRMMLKVLLYAYCQKIYSGRKISQALKRDVAFMWLSGNQSPDFRTINLFRSGRLKTGIEDVFKSLLLFMFDEGYIKIEDYYCDGTIIQADANKHKATWKKNLQRYRERIEARIDETIKEIEELCHEEGLLPDSSPDYQVAPEDPTREERINNTVEKMNALMQSEKKEVKQKVKKLAGDLYMDTVKEKIYEEKEEICGDRSGYSNTDTDASMMRTKECQEDLRPGYNVMIGSENQFVTGISVHQNTNDGACFKEHMERREESLPISMQGRTALVVADAIFGTEENYTYLNDKGIGSLLKYPLYDKEATLEFKNNLYLKENMPYDSQRDTFLCPNGKLLIFKEETWVENKNKFKSLLRRYECEDCSACPHFDKCGGNREEGSKRNIQINRKLEEYKETFRKKVQTGKGKEKMRQRGHDVETVFGDTKQNQQFRRFHLRGIEKVTIEVTVVAIAHNLRKMGIIQQRKANDLKKAG
jgi:Transposase and inactivated derivatives